jgi:hypothetical protein
MAIKEMIKCFTFEKEEREKQKWAQGKGILIGAIFVCTQDTIEGVSDLRLIAVLLRGEFSWLIRLSSAIR